MNQALRELIGQYKDLIDREIGDELARRQVEVRAVSDALGPVLEAIRELSLGGKRLRGLLVILGYELAGGKVSAEIVKAAAAVEIFHLGLLIQDDVMDRDERRRGARTIHTRYRDLHQGEAVATLAGDYAFGWCSQALSSLELPARQVNAAIGVWSKYFVRVGYGQTLDVLKLADEKSILKILSIKSGEYSCVLPLLLGATLGGGKPELLDRLEQYGLELGNVFQLRDDYLGMYGDAAKTGKGVGHDAREGKHTYATMYGRANTESEIKRHLDEGIKLAGESKVMKALVKWMAEREN